MHIHTSLCLDHKNLGRQGQISAAACYKLECLKSSVSARVNTMTVNKSSVYASSNGGCPPTNTALPEVMQ